MGRHVPAYIQEHHLSEQRAGYIKTEKGKGYAGADPRILLSRRLNQEVYAETSMAYHSLRQASP